MSPERIIPCQFNPLLDCEQRCPLYTKGSQSINELAEGLEISEDAVIEKLRTQFSQLEPREKGRMIMDKITILGEKQIDPTSCVKFESSERE